MNIRGSKKGDKFPILGTVKLSAEQVGRGKLTAGIHKTDSKAFQSYMADMASQDFVMMTLQRDNRGLSKEQADTNPYLQTVSVPGKDGGAPTLMHGIRISNMAGAERDAEGKVVKGADGKPVISDKKTQMQQIFEKIPSVEVIKNEHGSFMHFAMNAPVFRSSSGRGLMIDVNEMEGRTAEKGMADAHFKATLDAKRFAKAEREAKEAQAGPAGMSKQADGGYANVPEGIDEEIQVG